MNCEPLELEYICSYLSPLGHNIEIIDMIFEKRPLEYYIKKYKPDIVGFTAYITHVGVVKGHSEAVKRIKKNCITVVGGVHAEVMAEDFEDQNIDYVIKVNGLKTFKEIVDNLDRGKTANRELIEGVWNGHGKAYEINTQFDYPHPDRKITQRYRKFYNYIFHSKCALLKTSFGCAFNCDFCFCIQITQCKYFERDLDEVIQELRNIEENNIFIVDDNFLYKKERVLEFCRLLERYGINEDIIKTFGELGLKAVFVGIESFKAQDLKDYNKKTSVEINEKAIRILDKYDIECYSGIIVNMDWQDKDFNHLTNWLNKFKRPLVNIQPITPMPGTPLYSRLEPEICVPREAYESWDMAHIVLKTKAISSRRFYYNIMKTYYRTSADFAAHIYIFRKYGLRVYLRNLKGSLYITWQYLKLMLQKGE
jgi:radical SAM superfamily enzyme YgiQ (UPF0313 family)